MARTNPIAARIRAAAAYADMSKQDAGQLMGVSARQFTRYEAGLWKTPPSTEQLDALADGCKVPRMFIHGGWSGIEDQPTLAERVEALEHRLEAGLSPDRLREMLAQLQAGHDRAMGREQQGTQESPGDEGRPPAAGGASVA